MGFVFNKGVASFDPTKIVFVQPGARRRAVYTLQTTPNVTINGPAVGVDLAAADFNNIVNGGYSSFRTEPGLAVSVDGDVLPSSSSASTIGGFPPTTQASENKNDDDLSGGAIAGSELFIEDNRRRKGTDF